MKYPLTVAGRSQHLSRLVHPKLQTISNIWSWNYKREKREQERMLQMASIELQGLGMKKHALMHITHSVLEKDTNEHGATQPSE